MHTDIVIIGAGQAGLTAATTLRGRGWPGAIHLVGDEDRDPYQRPPLSKGYLHGSETRDDLLLCAPEALVRDGITFHRGRTATRIDRASQTVQLDSGASLEYEALILATGSTPRRLTLPGSDLAGIHSVRTVDDCDALRADLARGGDTVFIGGGFLNLEVAIEAIGHGAVTVLEMAPQVLGRVLSREAAAALAEYHAQIGVRITCGAQIVGLTAAGEHEPGVPGAGGAAPRVAASPRRVAGVQLADGSVVPAERVVVSIGAEPRDELARAAGLETGGGIVVDASLRTSDDRIFAIGDCAQFPSAHAGAQMRVESVQNATDHARFVAAQLMGEAAGSYRDVPWFWSTQGERRLQIAGIAQPGDAARVVLTEEGGKLVVERIRDGEVVAVETINAPGPHMRARRALAVAATPVA